MKIRRFIAYSLIYICLICVAIYALNSSDYTLNVFSYSLNLPVAIWFIAPICVFALLALAHMLYHSLEIYRYKRAIKKDMALFENMAKELLLGFESNKEFKTDIFKIPAQILRSLLEPDKSQKIDNAELNEILECIKNIKNNKVADIKKFKLPKDSVLNLKNEQNKIETLSNYYLEVIKNPQNFSDELINLAFDKLINFGDFIEIKRAKRPLNADQILSILTRFINDKIALNSDEIYDLLNSTKITKEQYIKAAIMLKNKLKPDIFINIFERLKNINVDADEAYIYALYELGMIDKIRESINGSDQSEFKEIKTLIFLRDQGKSAPSSLFFK